MRLEFEGVLDFYGGDLTSVSPEIGGRNVITEIEQAWPWKWGKSPSPNVKVLLGVDPIANGELWALHGFGGTEVTPPESPELTIGGWDVLERLRDLDGRTVALTIQDIEEKPCDAS